MNAYSQTKLGVMNILGINISIYMVDATLDYVRSSCCCYDIRSDHVHSCNQSITTILRCKSPHEKMNTKIENKHVAGESPSPADSWQFDTLCIQFHSMRDCWILFNYYYYEFYIIRTNLA